MNFSTERLTGIAGIESIFMLLRNIHPLWFKARLAHRLLRAIAWSTCIRALTCEYEITWFFVCSSRVWMHGSSMGRLGCLFIILATFFPCPLVPKLWIENEHHNIWYNNVYNDYDTSLNSLLIPSISGFIFKSLGLHGFYKAIRPQIAELEKPQHHNSKQRIVKTAQKSFRGRHTKWSAALSSHLFFGP